MTNFEKIKNMDIDELAKLLNGRCSLCVFDTDGDECAGMEKDAPCIDGVRKWLEQEAE